MSRSAKGTVEWRAGAWKARVTMPDGSRPWIPMAGIARDDRARAELAAAALAIRAKERGSVPKHREETVSEWFTRWTAWRALSKVSDAKKQADQFAKHIEPIIGTLPIRSVDRGHMKGVVARLDELVSEGAMRWKTAANIWGFVAKALKDATDAKDLALCVLDANPAKGVQPPDKGARTRKQYLYPSEATALFSSPNVPRWRQRIYAFAVYTYMRSGEIAALEWPDVDIERGIIRVHQAVDRGKPGSSADSTKSERERLVVIEPTLAPLLEAMAKESGRRGLVFARMPPGGGHDGEAPTLRGDLLAAGVTREGLFLVRPTTKRLTFHDLRATGVTWAAIRGDDPLKIMARSGHATYQTMLVYVREAEVLRETGAFGTPFPALPAELLEEPPARKINRPGIVLSSKNGHESSVNWRPQGDSNPWTKAADLLGKAGSSAGRAAKNRPSEQNGQGGPSAFGVELDLYAILEAVEAAGTWPSPGGDA